MKLRKNDYQELKKAGQKAIDAKLAELALAHAKTSLQKMKNDLKNPREPRLIRLAIARLMTMQTELRGAK